MCGKFGLELFRLSCSHAPGWEGIRKKFCGDDDNSAEELLDVTEHLIGSPFLEADFCRALVIAGSPVATVGL